MSPISNLAPFARSDLPAGVLTFEVGILVGPGYVPLNINRKRRQ